MKALLDLLMTRARLQDPAPAGTPSDGAGTAAVAPAAPAAPAAPLPLVSDARGPARAGALVLGLGLGGFLLWAALAPLDEGVPTPGTVMLDTKRKTVQHPSGGVIAQVHVREAQEVKAGEPLLTLQDASARANFQSVRQHYLGYRAWESRLLAEQRGDSRIELPRAVLEQQQDPLVQQHVATQQQLFASRRQALQSELTALGEAIEALQASVRGYQDQLHAREQQAGLFRDELAGLRDLVEEGYAPRNKQRELERQLAENSAAQSQLRASIASAQRQIAETAARRQLAQQQFRRDVDTQLAEVQREVAADEEKLAAVRQELERMVVRAPASGAVVGIATQTVGGVVQPAARILDVVPRDEALLLESRVPPHLIDRIHPGQATDIRFAGFAHSPQLVVDGKLLSVSADLLTDEATRQPYYLARVQVTAEGRKTLGERQLVPGMPAEVIIKTGERSMLTYLAGPLLKRLAQGLKEE